jgi:molybdopterin synthase sulfur carrier subunit
MKVKIKLYGDLKEKSGKSEIELIMPEGTKMRDLIDIISKDYLGKETLLESSGKLKSTIIVLVNGKNIDFIDKLETKLSDGDLISLVPAVFGG